MTDFLGHANDLCSVRADCAVTFGPKPSTRNKAVAMIEEVLWRQKLTPGTASKLRGLLQWLDSGLHGRPCRGAFTALVARQYYERTANHDITSWGQRQRFSNKWYTAIPSNILGVRWPRTGPAPGPAGFTLSIPLVALVFVIVVPLVFVLVLIAVLALVPACLLRGREGTFPIARCPTMRRTEAESTANSLTTSMSFSQGALALELRATRLVEIHAEVEQLNVLVWSPPAIAKRLVRTVRE